MTNGLKEQIFVLLNTAQSSLPHTNNPLFLHIGGPEVKAFLTLHHSTFNDID